MTFETANKISIVVPVFNESTNIYIFHERLIKTLTEIKTDYEIIFVDDGSTDDTWRKIEELNEKNDRILGIRFSKNFGHQYALKAGIDHSSGDAVISMDGDLQHPPELIKKFIEHWRNGYDIIYALRKDTRGVSYFKKATSKLYYKVLNFVSDIHFEAGSSDFRLLDKKVVDEIKELNENQLFLRGIVSWLGFNSISVEYIADERYSGVSKFSLTKMIKFAVDGVMSFSIRPLRIASVLGLFISFLAFVYIFYALYVNIFLHEALPGWTSILVSVLILGGIQLISIGLLGEYLGKLFMESKRRKNYIIEKEIKKNFNSTRNRL